MTQVDWQVGCEVASVGICMLIQVVACEAVIKR